MTSVDSSVTMWHWYSYAAILDKIVDVEMKSGGYLRDQNVSATLRIEGCLMTVGVGSSSFRNGHDVSGFCINGNWYREVEPSSLRRVRDVDKSVRNLHCLMMLDWDRGSEEKWMLACLLIQPTGAKRGQFRRYGRVILSGKNNNLRHLSDLQNAQNEEQLEFESVGEDGKYIVTIV
jgi:hypothetical protein